MPDRFSLDQLVSEYNDFARSYLFELVLPTGKNFKPNHTYLVKSTALPTSTMGIIEADFQGNKYKLAGTQEFSDFTVSFRSDIADDIRKLFLTWMNDFTHNPEDNVHGSPLDYMEDITLKHKDGLGSTILTYNLIKAFPSVIGEITLDYGNKEIASFDVTFAYQYHTVL